MTPTPPPPNVYQQPLRLAVRLALVGLATATPMIAAAQPTTAAPTDSAGVAAHVFDIPPGTLGETLARFAAAAGVALSFDAAGLRGIHSEGLRGRYTVEDGFARLLATSNLEAVHQGGGNYLLRTRPPSSTTTLAPVTVTGAAEAGTQGNPSYASSAVTIGKGTQRLRDIPQSLSVVTRQRIEDQNLTTVADAMRQTTGMTVVDFGTGTAGVSARGFSLDAMQIDGIAVQTGQGMWGTSSFDLALYDRLEVLRGPAGILQGSGEPGGTINLARKRAHAERTTSTAVQVGSWDRYRTEVDATGALDGEGRLRGRVVAMYEDNKSFIDTVYSRKPLFYGTLEYDIAPATTLSAGYTTQRMTSRPTVGLPMYADGRVSRLPRSTYIGSNWDKKTEEANQYFVEAEHRFDDGGEARLRLSRLDRAHDLETSAFGDSYIDPATGDIALRLMRSKQDTRDTGIDAYLSRPFEAMQRVHRFTIGADARVYDYTMRFAQITGVTQNVFDPRRDIPKPDFVLGAPTRYKNTQYGVHGQLQLHVADATQIVLGGRISNWETDNKSNPSASYRIRREFTPNAAILHDLSDEWTVYASHARIFQPQNGQTVALAALDPRTGTQYELGIKGGLAGDRIAVHAALFRINDENRAMSDPDNPGFSISAGKVRSEGFEAELSGQVNERWNVMAGYAWTKSRYLKADAVNIGSGAAPDTPKHSVKLWNTYRLSAEPSHGWSVGGGLEYNSGVYADRGGVRWKQDAYAIVSARVDYRFDERWSLSLNGENLFDKKYYTRMAGWFRQSYYGNPRNFTLSLRGQF